MGITFVDVLAMFQEDPETEAVVLIGEIGGTREQEAAEFIRADGFTKPLIASVVGETAPLGKRMGHAGAIIAGETGLASVKTRALEEAGAIIVPTPADIGAVVRKTLGTRRAKERRSRRRRVTQV